MKIVTKVVLGELVLCFAGWSVCPTPTATSHAFPRATTVYYHIAEAVALNMATQISDSLTDWTNNNFNSPGQNESYILFHSPAADSHPYIYFSWLIKGSTQLRTVKSIPVCMHTQIFTAVVAATTTFYLGSDFLRSDLPNFDSMVAKGARHEIGHALGIKDQPDSQQTAGESVVNHAVDPNDSGNNMPTTVRSCDNQGVKTTYNNSVSGVGDGGGGGYTTYTYQYIIEDDSESGCACHTTYQETDYFYNGYCSKQYSQRDRVLVYLLG